MLLPNRKLIAIFAAITATTAVSIGRIYVVENFEKPFTFRISAAVMKIISFWVIFKLDY